LPFIKHSSLFAVLARDHKWHLFWSSWIQRSLSLAVF